MYKRLFKVALAEANGYFSLGVRFSQKYVK